jgi:hypothetical protein
MVSITLLALKSFLTSLSENATFHVALSELFRRSTYILAPTLRRLKSSDQRLGLMGVSLETTRRVDSTSGLIPVGAAESAQG